MTGALSGIVYVIKQGLQWKDAPVGYGLHKTLYNRFIRWSRTGVFDRIFAALAGQGPKPQRIMSDATHLKAHRTAASLLKQGMFPVSLGRTKGGLNSKLHIVCNQDGKTICLLLSEGQMSDYKGAALLLPVLPDTQELIVDRDYDADWFWQAFHERKIKACISPRKGKNTHIHFDRQLYWHCHKIKNLFAKLKDWQRIATHYDRCAHTYFCAICIAATMSFSLN